MEGFERDSLLADLGHGDEEIRRLAVERLSLLPAADAVALLVECLGDQSWRVRKAAVERLTALEHPAGPVRALVAALADGENSGRRNAALEALTRFGSVAVPSLVEASHAGDVDVRKQAVDALAAIAAPAAADRLIELMGDPDGNVRAAAAEALGGFDPEPAAACLSTCAKADPEPLVRLAALRSLARLEVALPVAELSAALSDPLLRPSAYALLAFSEDPGAFEELVKALSSPARSVREAAMEALVKRAKVAAPGEDALLFGRLQASLADLPFLPDALQRLSEAPLVTRLVLVQFLGWLGRPDCVLPLLEAAHDEALTEVVLGVLAGAGPEVEAQLALAWPTLSEATRRNACALLGRTRGEQGEATLLRALAKPDTDLRITAARSLAERGAHCALPPLVAALRAAALLPAEAEASEIEAPLEIEQAIRTLLEGADEALADRAFALLEAEIEEAPQAFRLAMARLLGSLGGPAHQRRIELLLSDPSATVRRAAVEALAHIAPGQLELLRCALADESPGVRVGAVSALAGSGDPAVIADLASMMDDSDPRVAAAALRGLARWVQAADNEEARGRALLLLSVGLAHGGTSGLAALDALARIGGEDAVALAQGALSSPDCEIVEAAVGCVGQHGSRASLQGLLLLLGHPHWNVRARIAQVMEERRHVHAMPALIRQLEEERDEFTRAAILIALATLESR